MEVVVILVLLGVVTVAIFVLAPLVRSEENLKSLNRPRPGTRNLSGPDTGRIVRLNETAEGIQFRCPQCAALVETDFEYCGECATKLRQP